ncbi:hypothetical protein ABW19_dt0208606 [Dactylella cylindrospora]|nr:hypothetical protein ABW19_dt0208606 [Dactylella cylindrospora]
MKEKIIYINYQPPKVAWPEWSIETIIYVWQLLFAETANLDAFEKAIQTVLFAAVAISLVCYDQPQLLPWVLATLTNFAFWFARPLATPVRGITAGVCYVCAIATRPFRYSQQSLGRGIVTVLQIMIRHRQAIQAALEFILGNLCFCAVIMICGMVITGEAFFKAYGFGRRGVSYLTDSLLPPPLPAEGNAAEVRGYLKKLAERRRSRKASKPRHHRGLRPIFGPPPVWRPTSLYLPARQVEIPARAVATVAATPPYRNREEVPSPVAVAAPEPLPAHDTPALFVFSSQPTPGVAKVGPKPPPKAPQSKGWSHYAIPSKPVPPIARTNDDDREGNLPRKRQC